MKTLSGKAFFALIRMYRVRLKIAIDGRNLIVYAILKEYPILAKL
ncbi:hypothetical protein [Desulfitobacterium dehalogenans]|nr:hypothetical protein [Desulfitobacterium dehalogenans]